MATQNEFRRVEKKEEIKVSLLLQVDDVDEWMPEWLSKQKKSAQIYLNMITKYI